MNTKRKFTAITQLHTKNNPQIVAYVDDTVQLYSKVLREAFYSIRNRNENNFNKSEYNTYLQSKYHILFCTANSIIIEAQARLSAIKELKKYEKSQLERKISYLENTLIPKLQSQKDINCQKLRDGKVINLESHRNFLNRIITSSSHRGIARCHLLVAKISLGVINCYN